MRKVILLIFTIFIVLGVVFAFFILNRPAKELTQAEKEKVLTQIVGRKLNLTGNDIPTGDITYKGKYSSFIYPAAGKIYHQIVNGKEAKDGGALDYFSFDLNDPSVNVVTEVISAPASAISVSDYPAVSLRKTQHNAYKEVVIQTNTGVGGIGFNKQDETGFEKTGFFLINGKIYSFSVKSADEKLLNEVFGKLISSLKFY